MASPSFLSFLYYAKILFLSEAINKVYKFSFATSIVYFLNPLVHCQGQPFSWWLAACSHKTKMKVFCENCLKKYLHHITGRLSCLLLRTPIITVLWSFPGFILFYQKALLYSLIQHKKARGNICLIYFSPFYILLPSMKIFQKIQDSTRKQTTTRVGE